MNDHPRMVHRSTVNGDYFDYIAAFGAFTEVSYATNRMAKNILGKLAYFLEGVKRLASVRKYNVEITIGKKVLKEKVIYGMVTNSFSVAGFLSLYKEEAKLDDGLFEAFFIKAPKNLIELQTIINALLAGDISCKYFIYRQISEIKIIADEPLSWTIDGEYGGTFFETDIKNHPKAVQFIRHANEEDV